MEIQRNQQNIPPSIKMCIFVIENACCSFFVRSFGKCSFPFATYRHRFHLSACHGLLNLGLLREQNSNASIKKEPVVVKRVHNDPFLLSRRLCFAYLISQTHWPSLVAQLRSDQSRELPPFLSTALLISHRLFPATGKASLVL